MQSLARALEYRQGETPGRAPLRILLVAVLVALQSVEVSDAFALLGARLVWAVPVVCVGALAASLGFAAAQARAGTGWRAFATDRLRMAGPAYAFAVLAAAFALGPAVTNAGARGYFTDPRTFLYLSNLLGWPRLDLPGVFEFNALSGVVNRNVLAAPVALLVLAAVCWSPVRRIPRLAWAALPALVAVAAVATELASVDLGDASGPPALLLRGLGLSALLGGLAGAAMFRLRDRVRIDSQVALGAAAAPGVLALIGDASGAQSAWFPAACAVPVAYLTLWLSLGLLPGARVVPRAERYLFGAFLLSFPLQQLLISEGPLQGNLPLNFAVGGAAAAALSVLFGRTVGRYLLGARLRSALAAETVAAAGPARARRRGRRTGTVVANLAVGAVFVALCLGLMAMLYLAFQPDSGGI